MPASLKATLATLLLTLPLLAQQERGLWRADSSTARAITGDIGLSDTEGKLVINFLSFTISRIRPLEPAEAAAAFDTETHPAGAGSLYRLDIPASRKFLHKNSLCGSDATQWMVTYAAGKSLQIAFFSSAKPPVLTKEAIDNSSDLCGTYSYVR